MTYSAIQYVKGIGNNINVTQSWLTQWLIQIKKLNKKHHSSSSFKEIHILNSRLYKCKQKKSCLNVTSRSPKSPLKGHSLAHLITFSLLEGNTGCTCFLTGRAHCGAPHHCLTYPGHARECFKTCANINPLQSEWGRGFVTFS